ncbi:MAG: FkbM family methyltransferase [Paracoccaceae bacterium]
MNFIDIEHKRELLVKRWKNVFYGEQCILVCNGPSLKDTQFSKLNRDRYKIFGLNKIYLAKDLYDFEPDFIVAVNKLVINQSAEAYRNLQIPKFISNRVDHDSIDLGPNCYQITTTGIPANADRFSLDPSQYVHEGWTVTHAALQLIRYMGFTEVNIIGMDHKFQQHEQGQENIQSVILGPDKDHFTPNYFGFGQEWDFPDLENSEISYQAAKECFERTGRSIVDCTIDGSCQIFAKGKIEDLYLNSVGRSDSATLKNRKADLSVIVLPDDCSQDLDATINSINLQLGITVEIIVLNAESAINSQRIKNFNLHTNSFIRVINYPKGGQFEALEHVIESCVSESIVILNSGDELSKNFLTNAIGFLHEGGSEFGFGRVSMATASGYPTGLQLPLNLNLPIETAKGFSVVGQKSLFRHLMSSLRTHGDYNTRTFGDVFSGFSGILPLDSLGVTHSLQNISSNDYWHKWVFASVVSNFLIGKSTDVSSADMIFFEKVYDLTLSIVNANKNNLERSIEWVSNEEKFLLLEPLLRTLSMDFFDALFCVVNDCSIEDLRTIDLSAWANVFQTIKSVRLDRSWPQLVNAIGDKFKQLDPRKIHLINQSVPALREQGCEFDAVNFCLQLFEKTILHSPSICIDVGAHRGGSTKKMLESGAKIFAFEPDIKNRRALVEEYGENPRVVIDSRALGDKEFEVIDFFESDVSSGISSTIPFHVSHKRSGSVLSTNLKKIFEENKIGHVDFLKIDAEAADFMVLRGFPWQLDQPDVVLCEFDNKRTRSLGFSHIDICKFFQDKGYWVLVSEWYPIEKFGKTHFWRQLQPYPYEMDCDDYWGDLIAVKSPIEQATLDKLRFENITIGN